MQAYPRLEPPPSMFRLRTEDDMGAEHHRGLRGLCWVDGETSGGFGGGEK